MSLKVWLPLDGDLRNLGCSDIEVTNNGATVDNSGKIGKCYSFDGTNDYIVGTYTPTTNISFCCWAYFPAILNRKHIFDGRNNAGNSGYQPMYMTASGIQIGGSGSGYPTLSYTWATNTWYHICVTHDAQKGSLYINGNFISSSTAAKGFNAPECNFTLGSRCNQGNYSNVKLNDVRIYDHCLSAAEVREIAMGLVLHYKLDDITNGVVDSSGYGHNGEINSELYLSNNSARYENSISFDGVDDCIKIPFNEIIKDKNYTISVWTYKTTIGTKSYQTILGGPSGFELEARSVSSTSPLYRIHNWGGGTTPYEFNKWNLFTFVHSDSNSKLYVNGELKITGTSVNIPTGNYYIGAWRDTSSQNYEGQMSDFRIYCTPLLDNDIKILYNVGMKIDNLGEIHTFEFKEDENEKLLKTGILKTNEMEEITIQTAKLEKNKGWLSPNFIEI